MSEKNEKDVVKEACEEELEETSTEKDAEEVFEEKDEISILQEKITELETELEEQKNDFLKAYADVENTRKRLINDFNQKDKYKLQNFVSELLPALDNLERALKETDESLPVYQGIEMVYKQLMNSLEKEGVSEIEALGEKFDPNIHHAVMSEEVEDQESDIVVEVLQKGYKLKDRVIRASMVKISE